MAVGNGSLSVIGLQTWRTGISLRSLSGVKPCARHMFIVGRPASSKAASALSPLDDNRWSYHVEVTESDGSGSQTRHKVNMDKEYYEKISNGIIGLEDFVENYTTNQYLQSLPVYFSLLPNFLS